MAVGVAQAVDTPLESMQSRTMNPLSSTAFMVPAPGVLWPAPTEAQPPSQAFEGRLTGPSGRKRRKPQFDSRQNGGGGTKSARRRGHHGRKGAQYRKRHNTMPPAAPRNTNTSLLRAHGVPPTTGVAGKRSPSQTPPPDGTNRPATEAELAGIGDPFGTNVGVVTRDDFHDRLSDGGEGSFGMDDNEGSTRCSLDGGSWESGDEGDGQQEAQCSDEGERCEGEVEGERHEEYVKKLESDNETLRQRVEELEKRLQSSQKP